MCSAAALLPSTRDAGRPSQRDSTLVLHGSPEQLCPQHLHVSLSTLLPSRALGSHTDGVTLSWGCSALFLCFARCHTSCELTSASLLHSTPRARRGGRLGCSWAHAQDPAGGARRSSGGVVAPSFALPGPLCAAQRFRPSGMSEAPPRRARRSLPAACCLGRPCRADPHLVLVCSRHTFFVGCVLQWLLPIRILFVVPFVLLF